MAFLCPLGKFSPDKGSFRKHYMEGRNRKPPLLLPRKETKPMLDKNHGLINKHKFTEILSGSSECSDRRNRLVPDMDSVSDQMTVTKPSSLCASFSCGSLSDDLKRPKSTKSRTHGHSSTRFGSRSRVQLNNLKMVKDYLSYHGEEKTSVGIENKPTVNRETTVSSKTPVSSGGMAKSNISLFYKTLSLNGNNFKVDSTLVPGRNYMAASHQAWRETSQFERGVGIDKCGGGRPKDRQQNYKRVSFSEHVEIIQNPERCARDDNQLCSSKAYGLLYIPKSKNDEENCKLDGSYSYSYERATAIAAVEVDDEMLAHTERMTGDPGLRVDGQPFDSSANVMKNFQDHEKQSAPGKNEISQSCPTSCTFDRKHVLGNSGYDQKESALNEIVLCQESEFGKTQIGLPLLHHNHITSRVGKLEIDDLAEKVDKGVQWENVTNDTSVQPSLALVRMASGDTREFLPADQTLVSEFGRESKLKMRVCYDYVEMDENDLSVVENDIVYVLNTDDEDWWWVRTPGDKEGFVPKAFLSPQKSVKKLSAQVTFHDPLVKGYHCYPSETADIGSCNDISLLEVEDGTLC